MKVFLDEQLIGLTDYLFSLGWDTTNVINENMRGSEDLEIVLQAKEEKYIIVTQDDKVAQLAKLHELPHVYLSFSKIAAMIHIELKELEKNL